MSMKSEIRAALHAHAAWRKQFRDILNGRVPFDLEQISATDQCIFGQWLNNEGQRLIPADLHQEISAAHKEFHQFAAEILQKIRQKRYAEARVDISPDGGLNRASLRLRKMLVQLSFRQAGAAG
jgi:hypothetical protein